ncbi:MAG: thioredoxin-like domain-containing protein [Pirellulales bacterium]
MVAAAGLGSTAWAATPTAEQALKLVPNQKDVEFDTPSAGQMAQCQIKAEKVAGKTGWVIRDPQGQILRKFVDTNGDNVVDRWSFYQDGIEVYRDIDTNYNGKIDQCRWLNIGGSRWGVDTNEDGKIDAWKSISAEEVSAEVAQALRDRDPERFQRVLLTKDELGQLRLDPVKAKELEQRTAAAVGDFTTTSGKQKVLGPKSRWVDFGGLRPSIVPGDDGGADLLIYDNTMAIMDTSGQTGQIHLGTLVRVGDGWRVVDGPQMEAITKASFSGGPDPADTPAADAPGENAQRLLGELEKLDQQMIAAASLEEQAKVNAQRADLLEKLVEQAGPEDRASWIRQLADTVSAAVQSGGYPDGVARLQAMAGKLTDPADADLKTYVEFRHLMADYVLKLQTPGGDAGKTQTDWLANLEKFVKDHPQSPDAPEAMLQLATTHEFAGNEAEALKWYGQIASDFSQTPIAKKAQGAQVRLQSVGKPIKLVGKTTKGQTFDIDAYRNKSLVLIHYWASWSEPCKAELPQLRELQAKYGKRGLMIVGVNLDSSRKTLDDYMAKDKNLTWPQLYEEGGLDSRYANELGIPILPTMILVGKDGKVLNRGIHVSELDSVLSGQLK